MRTPEVGLSIVTSMYASAPFVEEFYRRVVAAATPASSSFEIVLVNDGSPDNALEVALRLRAQDPRVRVVDLSRNFGHHKALMTGLARARGDLTFLIDCDLEEDPAWLLPFLDALHRTRADVVYGVQRRRKGGWLERFSGRVFFAVFNRLLSHPIPQNAVTARVMTRRYVDALVRHRDREVCLAGLWTATGFEQRPIKVDKGKRAGTTYTWRRRVSALVNALTSFSSRPLIYVFYMGIAVMLLSLAAGLGLVVRTFTHGINVPGYASLMVSVWFLGGLTIFCIGIVGVYVAKIFTETKDRPYTIVRAEYGASWNDDARPDLRTGEAVLRE
jgi:putative glycosyltransferase